MKEAQLTYLVKLLYGHQVMLSYETFVLMKSIRLCTYVCHHLRIIWVLASSTFSCFFFARLIMRKMVNNQYCHIFPFVATSVSISIYWYAQYYKKRLFCKFLKFPSQSSGYYIRCDFAELWCKIVVRYFETLEKQNKIYIKSKHRVSNLQTYIYCDILPKRFPKISRPTLVLQKTLGLHIKEMRQRINVSLSVVG